MKKTWSLHIVPYLVFIIKMSLWTSLICSPIGDTIVDWLKWTTERLCEPSTWAGIGCALIGIGIVSQTDAAIFVGILMAGMAMIVREKSKK